MLYRHVFDKISTEFRGILRAFVNFADLHEPEFHSFATAPNIAIPELRHLHYTNWRLKICIWRLYFSSGSPKGDLRISLISSRASRLFFAYVIFAKVEIIKEMLTVCFLTQEKN